MTVSPRIPQAYVPSYDLPNAAPEPLRLVQLFVNTADREHGREWLATPEALRDWFAERDVDFDGASGAADLRRAHELREAVRALLCANNGAALGQNAVAAFNRAVAAAGVRPLLDVEGRLDLQPARGGVDGALGRVVTVALAAMLDGSWPRLKACAQCRWAFYDYSK